ncbi:hypothetical protein XELAEV_18004079mg [Xenopus laevis]|uniref:Uncharacterized protein n=1 Tax=Xenopus laevis TaxID=8355 RepID=A0A974BNH3_XENLA|nr:hypothetical protein XELAEV_18004079mg [Xenopus laevis]
MQMEEIFLLCLSQFSFLFDLAYTSWTGHSLLISEWKKGRWVPVLENDDHKGRTGFSIGTMELVTCSIR